MSTNLAPLVLPPTTIEVAPTETTLAEFDTRYTEVLTIQVTNASGDAQTFVGAVYRRLDSSQLWALTTISDLASIADATSVVVDLDVRGTGQIKIAGSLSGAGGNMIITARRRAV